MFFFRISRDRPTVIIFFNKVYTFKKNARTKSALVGRIQVARVKCVAERIMLITCPRTRRPIEGRAHSPDTSPHTRRPTGEEN
jgi:hypothetical protein